MKTKPEFMSEPLTEIIYCVGKRGEYFVTDGHNKARLFSECQTFQEMRDLTVLINLSSDGEINDEVLSDFSSLSGYEIPKLDRLLKFPWYEGYEEDDQ